MARTKKTSSLITSFRLKSEEVEKLQQLLPNVVQDNSHSLLARKLVRDFNDGRLAYKNSRDRLLSRMES